VREVHIRIKDYDHDLLPLVRRRGLHCPVCGGVLAVHWARTAAEQDQADETDARRSVNAQLYARDHARADGLVLIPLSAYHDRLPGEARR
jgi:hypothetical protein